MTANVRPSPIAGMWYPDNADRLRAQIQDYLDAAEVEMPGGKIVGLMAPHAGYQYSGPVAAHAFKLVEGMAFDTVAVLSPMHRPHSGHTLTTSYDQYYTPLGNIPVNTEALKALEAAGISLNRVGREQEHSLEIELPFLQVVLADYFKLIPLMLREQSAADIEQLGHALAEVLRGRNALLVASSDLSHFYDQDTAERLDARMLDAVADFDPARVIALEKQGEAFACGRNAIAAVMWAACELGADRAKVVRYGTSGDASGDYGRVVGYGSAVFYDSKG